MYVSVFFFFFYKIRIFRVVSSLLSICFRESFPHCYSHIGRDWYSFPGSHATMLPKKKYTIGLVSECWISTSITSCLKHRFLNSGFEVMHGRCPQQMFFGGSLNTVHIPHEHPRTFELELLASSWSPITGSTYSVLQWTFASPQARLLQLL